jgi:hypothetical protein
MSCVVSLDRPAVQALYRAVDFIGISGYPRFQGQIADMEDATQAFDRELSVSHLDDKYDD